MPKSNDRPWEGSFRLPESVIPEHYELYMYPDMPAKTFSGKVTISLTSQEPRDHFLVHSQWLIITSTSLVKVNKNGSHLQVRSQLRCLPCAAGKCVNVLYSSFTCRLL